MLLLKIKKKVVAFAEFQELHARQLSADMKYEWAFDKYADAKRLYSGDTGNSTT